MGRLEKLRNQRRNERKKIKLISIRGIGTEQTCDSITVAAGGTGRREGEEEAPLPREPWVAHRCAAC